MYALTGAKPITTNNLTERINKTIESQCSRTQIVVSFIEHLYDVKFIKKSLVQSELDETLSDAGLATYWNMRMIEHKQMPFKKPINQKHHINQDVSEQIDKMIIKLINCDNINIPASNYLINISTNECTCYDYVWNESFRNAYYTCDTKNINAYDDKYDDSFAESTKYAQSDEYKGCDWIPKEFTNAAVTKRLCLDDNSIGNNVKLYWWISNKKIRVKNAKEI
ncbi:22758_t:CDS:2 [Cetraspora pellucida]|uniref:22758_t:CDS:1 n=1 Tax=Cetraspora pellucida TaxID=1433469 RepID=A0A9N9BDR1_9GLOM|nr:22758_t:CDS:2 [Cetraspora pellucida]